MNGALGQFGVLFDCGWQCLDGRMNRDVRQLEKKWLAVGDSLADKVVGNVGPCKNVFEISLSYWPISF